MNGTKIRVKSTSFEINKLITSMQLFSKIKLSISARLVLRCVVDFWNYKIGCAYPTQKTIAKCTGLTEVAVGKAIKELDLNGLIEKKKRNKRIYYYFTLKLLGYLELTPKVIYVDTQKKLSNIPKSSLDKNILKENENTSFTNSFPENPKDEMQSENDGKIMAQIMIKNFSNNPLFAKKVQEMKEKYGL